MQRWCSKLRSLAASSLHSFPKIQQLRLLSPHHNRLLHSSPNTFHYKSLTPLISPYNFNNRLFSNPSTLQIAVSNPASTLNPLSFTQVRHLTLKQRKRKLKSRRPMTPVVSKLKKIKMKSYSSYKGRFRTMNDGQIRRWKEGKRHNAHLKSKKAKRRLRQPGVVPVAYAKVMKKLNFCG